MPATTAAPVQPVALHIYPYASPPCYTIAVQWPCRAVIPGFDLPPYLPPCSYYFTPFSPPCTWDPLTILFFPCTGPLACGYYTLPVLFYYFYLAMPGQHPPWTYSTHLVLPTPVIAAASHLHGFLQVVPTQQPHTDLLHTRLAPTFVLIPPTFVFYGCINSVFLGYSYCLVHSPVF